MFFCLLLLIFPTNAGYSGFSCHWLSSRRPVEAGVKKVKSMKECFEVSKDYKYIGLHCPGSEGFNCWYDNNVDRRWQYRGKVAGGECSARGGTHCGGFPEPYNRYAEFNGIEYLLGSHHMAVHIKPTDVCATHDKNPVPKRCMCDIYACEIDYFCYDGECHENAKAPACNPDDANPISNNECNCAEASSKQNICQVDEYCWKDFTCMDNTGPNYAQELGLSVTQNHAFFNKDETNVVLIPSGL
jgi:hypothetical protein